MKDEPTLILIKTLRGLEAMDAIDAETLAEFNNGEQVEVIIRKRRSGPQHRLYWRTLGAVVKATDKWPSAKHLHDDVKVSLGYWTKQVTMSGQVTYRPDSTAFQKMDGQEFKVFFDRAMELIAREVGFDPLHTFEQRKAA